MKGGIIVIHGLPGTGKLDYALEERWGDRYVERGYEFSNPTIANVQYPDLDFRNIQNKGHDLIIMINSEWIVNRQSLDELLYEAEEFGYTLVDEIFIDCNYSTSDCNVKNKWSKEVAYRNYLLNKSSYYSVEYAKDERSQLWAGAWSAKEKYYCGKK